MRGEVIDFDLEQIKGQIASRPAPSNVKARQDFIDRKFRRRVKKISDQIKNLESSKVDRKIAEQPTKEEEKVNEKVAVESKTEETQPKKRPVKRKPTTKSSADKEE
jgi:hypothetical protein